MSHKCPYDWSVNFKWFCMEKVLNTHTHYTLGLAYTVYTIYSIYYNFSQTSSHVMLVPLHSLSSPDYTLCSAAVWCVSTLSEQPISQLSLLVNLLISAVRYRWQCYFQRPTTDRRTCLMCDNFLWSLGSLHYEQSFVCPFAKAQRLEASEGKNDRYRHNVWKSTGATQKACLSTLDKSWKALPLFLLSTSLVIERLSKVEMIKTEPFTHH